MILILPGVKVSTQYALWAENQCCTNRVVTRADRVHVSRIILLACLR